MGNLKFTAKVIHGTGIGNQIGFPTANLDNTDLALDYGVYLVEVKLDKEYQGLLHFGQRKTLDKKTTTEVYVINFNKNIYGENLEIKIIKKIRKIKKFSSINDLKKQVQNDLESVKK